MFGYPEERYPLEPYILLGDTGLRVSRLTLGAMTFGTKWSTFMGECDKDTARSIFREFVAAGGNFIDTADKYQEGQSEEWIGEFVKELEEEDENFDREQLIIATKYTINTKSRHANAGGNSRKNMYASLKSSLKRLQMDYVDILYLHVWDYTTSPKEIMRGLNSLVESGAVRYLGISDTPAWRVAQMNTIAEQYGWAKFCIYQGRYNIGERTLEYDVKQVCEEFNMGITPWSILGAGKFTGRMKRDMDQDDHEGRKVRSMTDRDFEILDVIWEVVHEQNESLMESEGLTQEQLDKDNRKVTPSRVALAWALEQPGMTTLLVGARKLEHIQDNIHAYSLRLTPDQLERLNEVSKPQPYFPFSMIGTDMFGTTVAFAGGRYVPGDWTHSRAMEHFETKGEE